MYEELNLLSISHILTVITCFGFAILFPRLLKNSTEKKLYKKDPEFRKDMDNVANVIDRLNKKYGKQYGKYS